MINGAGGRDILPATAAGKLDFWRHVGAVYMSVLPAVERDLQAVGNISYFEYQVLEQLAAVDGPMTMSQLAVRCHSSLSRLSHVARKLEMRKLLLRSVSLRDKRVTIAQLTPAGLELEATAGRIFRAAVEKHILPTLSSEELDLATRLLGAMLYRDNPEHWLLSTDHRDPREGRAAVDLRV